MTEARIHHFLEVDDLSAGELTEVLDLAEADDPPRMLAGRGMGLVFEKPSTRTRNATEMAVVQLGGHPVSMRADEVGLDTRETAEDVARTLGAFHAVLGARVFAHATVRRMAAVAGVPVVNLLSDTAHPCQALADLLTLRQRFGRLEGLTLGYVGDGNNVCRSLALACALAGVHLRVASPAGHQPPHHHLDRARRLGGEVVVTARPLEAVRGADAVYTDVWASMGQEKEAVERRDAFTGFTVGPELMAAASPHAVFLHCLPAHRGEEVAAEVVDGPRSLVWQQAGNRLHATRGLLLLLLEGGR